MRILHASEVDWGGVVSLIREFVGEQSAMGDEVTVLSSTAFPRLDGATMRPWSFVRSRPTTYPQAWRELRRTVREVEPDVVHLHSFMAGLVGRLPGAVDGVPVVYQPHAWSFDLRGQRLFSDSVKVWERFASRRTGAMVTNCQAEIDEGRAVGVRAEAFSIGVAVDPDHFHPVTAAEREHYRDECGVSHAHALVCVGRLVRQKGQDLLVAQWERSRPPDTELVLVGPGDVEPLRALAPTQWGRTIRAVGEQADVRPWLWASDALVLSSRYETVAIVVAEAMACGVPVVVNAVNGAQEVVSDGDAEEAGVVVPLGDMVGLLDEAGDILADPARAAAYGAAGRSRATQQFTRAAVADRLRAAYLRAIALQG